jgi:hypothetical protein
MLKWVVVAGVLIPAVVSARPIALDASTRADIRCVIALSREAGEAGAGAPQLDELATVTFYFVGRIEGREPKLDFGAAFGQEGKQMSHADYLALPETCRDEYRRSADALNRAVQAIPD